MCCLKGPSRVGVGRWKRQNILKAKNTKIVQFKGTVDVISSDHLFFRMACLITKINLETFI